MTMTRALIFESADATVGQPLKMEPLFGPGTHDEKWLQALLFAHPDTIPIDVIDPGAGSIVPICRELSLPKQGAIVFLDFLGVTPHGRLVLVECKLWRNPEARREVIAQILEYAALLRQWTYADLTARLKAKFLKATQRWNGPNPLYEHVRRSVAGLDEIRFVEAVSRSLATGDFNLIVAGDGIRHDVQAIANHLNSHSGLTSRLAFVQFQLWSDDAGRLIVLPTIPMRTEVLEQRVIVGANGIPLRFETAEVANEEAEAAVEPTHLAERYHNRSFWQKFIDGMHFDHPDQPPPRHGGNNWVKIDLPEPAGWMTGFRSKDQVGLFVTLRGERGGEAFDSLESEATVLQAEIDSPLRFDRKTEEPFKGTIGTYHALSKTISEEELCEWLTRMANRMVTALRPRLTAIASD
jgi:hypothetical protein